MFCVESLTLFILPFVPAPSLFLSCLMFFMFYGCNLQNQDCVKEIHQTFSQLSSLVTVLGYVFKNSLS